MILEYKLCRLVEHRDSWFSYILKNLTLPIVGIIIGIIVTIEIIIIGLTTTTIITITTNGTWKILQLSELYAVEGHTSVL